MHIHVQSYASPTGVAC